MESRISQSSSGRGRLPTCVVRIRSVLDFMATASHVVAGRASLNAGCFPARRSRARDFQPPGLLLGWPVAPDGRCCRGTVGYRAWGGLRPERKGSSRKRISSSRQLEVPAQRLQGRIFNLLGLATPRFDGCDLTRTPLRCCSAISLCICGFDRTTPSCGNGAASDGLPHPHHDLRARHRGAYRAGGTAKKGSLSGAALETQ